MVAANLLRETNLGLWKHSSDEVASSSAAERRKVFDCNTFEGNSRGFTAGKTVGSDDQDLVKNLVILVRRNSMDRMEIHHWRSAVLMIEYRHPKHMVCFHLWQTWTRFAAAAAFAFAAPARVPSLLSFLSSVPFLHQMRRAQPWT